MQECCATHPDLILLRDAAADERGAIADYIACAGETAFTELFLTVAEDEMQHFAATMCLITLLDPQQAALRYAACPPKWHCQPCVLDDTAEATLQLPLKKDAAAIRCLTKAIQDELHAINKYQQYYGEAKDTRVRKHFCQLMNDEKEHVAEFTAALFSLTHEPLEDHRVE